MINQKIIDAVLLASSKENKDKVLKEAVKHISSNYDYNDCKAAHFIAMLVDISEIVTPSRINLNWLDDNLDLIMYKSDKYNIKNIVVDSIDNIDCTISFTFDYIDKLNEDRDDVEYSCGRAVINFIDHPEILK